MVTREVNVLHKIHTIPHSILMPVTRDLRIDLITLNFVNFLSLSLIRTLTSLCSLNASLFTSDVRESRFRNQLINKLILECIKSTFSVLTGSGQDSTLSIASCTCTRAEPRALQWEIAQAVATLIKNASLETNQLKNRPLFTMFTDNWLISINF